MPIILLEDTRLHSPLPLLVWLMAAHHYGNYLPPEPVMSYLFCVVAAAARVPQRDLFPLPEVPQPQFRVISRAVTELPPESRDLVLAIQLRKAFGGMQHDLELCDSSAAAFCNGRPTLKMDDIQR